MTWKQAVFLGGAVVLLAACSNTTAPEPGLRQFHGAAHATSKGSVPQTMTTACRSGYSVNAGASDSTGACGVY